MDTKNRNSSGFQNELDEQQKSHYQVKENKTRSSSSLITIPTVVHIVYKDAVQNISDAQVYSQLQVLNEDFRRQNDDAINTLNDFVPMAADMEIEFCLATIDPAGHRTTGITRTYATQTSFGINDQIKFAAIGGKDIWDASKYLNIWVGEIEGGIFGYAQFPGGNPNTDGVVVDYRYFGTMGTVAAPFHLGRTTTHEVGHWLYLFHIWGDGGCNIDDAVADTPIASHPNYTNPPCSTLGPNSCVSANTDLPDMFQNYMDYSADACMNLFTYGQKARMRAMLEIGGPRASLPFSTACADTDIETEDSEQEEQKGKEEETSVDKIPAMNEWGLFLFVLLLLNIGIVFIYRLEKVLT